MVCLKVNKLILIIIVFDSNKFIGLFEYLSIVFPINDKPATNVKMPAVKKNNPIDKKLGAK